MLGARCSVLGARCSVLGARCSVLGARCSVLKKSAIGHADGTAPMASDRTGGGDQMIDSPYLRLAMNSERRRSRASKCAHSDMT
ncbi:hypothetical protein FNF07_23590 [Trinickia caryophylli]|nr:hypothetical protein FNF07_23590 [Trinickia caryophylli]